MNKLSIDILRIILYFSFQDIIAFDKPGIFIPKFIVMKKNHFITNDKLSKFTKSLLGLFIIIFISSLIVLSSCKKEEEDEDTPAVVTLQSDEFSDNTLNSFWIWADEPETWNLGSISEGWITFIGNIDANIFCDDNTSRLYQQITSTSDFDISTRMYCEWGNNSSDVAGLIVKSSSSGDWVLIKLWMWGDGSGRLEFQTQCHDIISPVAGSEANGGNGEYFLRIKRTGSNYTGYFKKTEADAWNEIGSTEFSDTTPLQIGLFGGTDEGDEEVLIQFDYFHI